MTITAADIIAALRAANADELATIRTLLLGLVAPLPPIAPSFPPSDGGCVPFVVPPWNQPLITCGAPR